MDRERPDLWEIAVKLTAPNFEFRGETYSSAEFAIYPRFDGTEISIGVSRKDGETATPVTDPTTEAEHMAAAEKIYKGLLREIPSKEFDTIGRFEAKDSATLKEGESRKRNAS